MARDGLFLNKRDTSPINIGWLCGIVDQMLPLADFCYRNEIEIQSFDYLIRHELISAARDRFFAIPISSHQSPLIHMAYMSMEGSRKWHFPVSEKELSCPDTAPPGKNYAIVFNRYRTARLYNTEFRGQLLRAIASLGLR